MKLWIDDIREAPEGYLWLQSTNAALRYIRDNISVIKHIDLDHDAGDYRTLGGDYVAILNEMERLSHRHKIDFNHITFRLHSMNPVGVENMRRIIERNGWIEIR